jgi:hypothetical protein
MKIGKNVSENVSFSGIKIGKLSGMKMWSDFYPIVLFCQCMGNSSHAIITMHFCVLYSLTYFTPDSH